MSDSKERPELVICGREPKSFSMLHGCIERGLKDVGTTVIGHQHVPSTLIYADDKIRVSSQDGQTLHITLPEPIEDMELNLFVSGIRLPAQTMVFTLGHEEHSMTPFTYDHNPQVPRFGLQSHKPFSWITIELVQGIENQVDLSKYKKTYSIGHSSLLDLEYNTSKSC